MLQQIIDELSRLSDSALDGIRSGPNIGHAAPSLLKLLAGATKCEWATFWKVDPDALVLRPIATLSSQEAPARQLELDTRNRTLSLSEGNAGHVWRTRRPIWTNDLVRDMCIPRSLDASASGLQGGIWFALKTDQVVYGVIELLGKKLPHSTEESIAAIEILGIKFGRLIEDNENKAQSISASIR